MAYRGILRGSTGLDRIVMISCRVTLNELPYDVADGVLCIDEVTEDTPNWQLLSHARRSRSFKFTPKPNEPSWFVRWGYNYSWNHLRSSFFGRDEATKDWRNVGHAERCHIPVVRYRLLGVPRLIVGSLDTLVVTEYIEDTRSLLDYFSDKASNRLAVEETLIQYGELLANIHENAIIHNNFSLENTLIKYDDATRLVTTDWYDMQVNRSDETAPFKKDLVTPVRELLSIGYSRERIQSFLNAYNKRMPWCTEQVEDIFIQAEAKAKRAK